MGRVMHSVRFLGFTLDRTTGELSDADRAVRLPQKLFLALNLLIEHANEVVSRDELCRHIWPTGTFVEFDDNLNATMKRLREALGDSAEAPRVIETVPRVGYRFIPTIIDDVGDPAPMSRIRSGQPAVPSESHFSDSRFAHWTRRTVLSGMVVMLFAILAASLGGHRETSLRYSGAVPKKLGIVAFTNSTGDADKNFLSNGLYREVAAGLRQLAPEKLAIILYESRQGVVVPSDVTIGRDLGLNYVLRGNLEKRDGNLSFRAALTDVGTSASAWIEEFRLPVQEVFVQHDIADRIQSTLSLNFVLQNREQLSHTCTTDTSAHEAYFRGREALLQDTDFSADAAIKWFKKAISEDSEYALPYEGLAQAYIKLGKSRTLSSERANQLAQRAVSAGIALDSTVPEFSLLRAIMLSNRPGEEREAQTDFERAIELDPGSTVAHVQYALFLRERHPESGLAQIKKAQAIDPLSPSINAYVGAALISTGQLEGAETQLQMALGLDPELPVTLRFLGNLEEKRGHAVQAASWYEKAATASKREPFYVYRLGLAYARSGRSSETMALLRELRTRSKREFVDPAYLKDLQAALGD
ncbi:MAG TPA: winged helix-turn-helix domain-containing protein [Candidatus Acidoferrales bacterium]|nr:winged helix-turn-helix domain-containing protein [Candidatus Acidoferrales bacterium]